MALSVAGWLGCLVAGFNRSFAENPLHGRCVVSDQSALINASHRVLRLASWLLKFQVVLRFKPNTSGTYLASTRKKVVPASG